MKFQETIEKILREALASSGFESSDADLVLEKPRLKAHGDVATPIALSLARRHRKNPMEIAEKIARSAVFPPELVAGVEVAKPGYINLRLSPEVLTGNLRDIEREADAYGASGFGRGAKCQVEYVSANPTGPLVVVSARAAAIGSVIVNLLRRVGFDAESEYYVNDYGKQVEALGESLRFRVRERFGKLGKGEKIGAYPGDYLKTIAARVTEADVKRWDDEDDGTHAPYGAFATDSLLQTIKEDLTRFGVGFDSFYRESSLHPDAIKDTRELIEARGYTYVEDGATYFATSKFGDEKDRVLFKSDGKPTYFMGDVAYHLTKFRRGYDHVIDLLGPDHHGHIARMKAAAAVIGPGADWLEILLVGWVRLVEGSKPVSMSKRAGEFITMRELIEDVGRDVAKYFFLMRRPNTPLDFDLELARKQSEENPVYYVQYAHARIASVIRFAGEKGIERSPAIADLSALSSVEERDLMLHLLFFPYVVEGAAVSREPHRLTVYAQELATYFHQFYHTHRIVTDDGTTSEARLLLAESTKQVLKNALELMGVAAPTSM